MTLCKNTDGSVDRHTYPVPWNRGNAVTVRSDMGRARCFPSFAIAPLVPLGQSRRVWEFILRNETVGSQRLRHTPETFSSLLFSFLPWARDVTRGHTQRQHVHRIA